MSYNDTAMEMTMPKPGMEMTEGEVDQFIIECRDKERAGWQKIADKLTKLGYRSRRTGEPITAHTCRFRYLNRRALKAEHISGLTAISIAASASAAERTVELIRSALKMKTDDKSKIAFITEILEKG